MIARDIMQSYFCRQPIASNRPPLNLLRYGLRILKVIKLTKLFYSSFSELWYLSLYWFIFSTAYSSTCKCTLIFFYTKKYYEVHIFFLKFLQIRVVWKLKMGVSLLNLVAKGKTASDFVLFSAARRRSVIWHEDLINRIFMQLHVFQTIFDQPKPSYMYKNDLKLCSEKASA